MAFYEPRPNYYEPRESPVTTPRRQLRVLRPAVNPSRSAGTLLASPSEFRRDLAGRPVDEACGEELRHAGGELLEARDELALHAQETNATLKDDLARLREQADGSAAAEAELRALRAQLADLLQQQEASRGRERELERRAAQLQAENAELVLSAQREQEALEEVDAQTQRLESFLREQNAQLHARLEATLKQQAERDAENRQLRAKVEDLQKGAEAKPEKAAALPDMRWAPRPDLAAALGAGGASARRHAEQPCVLVGDRPLAGSGFAITIDEVRTPEGSLDGGLGIGVVATPPPAALPERAWRVPKSCVVGYWGALYVDERPQAITWKSSTLKVGDQVEFHIVHAEVLVVVNGEVVVQEGVPGLPAPAVPVVDLFHHVAAVTLVPARYDPGVLASSRTLPRVHSLEEPAALYTPRALYRQTGPVYSSSRLRTTAEDPGAVSTHPRLASPGPGLARGSNASPSRASHPPTRFRQASPAASPYPSFRAEPSPRPAASPVRMSSGQMGPVMPLSRGPHGGQVMIPKLW